MAPNKQNTAETRKKLAANLQVMRRYDEHIQAIIGTTSHVVLYQFQQESSTWAKKDVEGALFLFERSSAPHYGFMVMNRLGIDNYTELLGPQVSIQPTEEFLIYRQSDGAVMGIWIYEEADRSVIATQMEDCSKTTKSAFTGPRPARLFPRNNEEERRFQQAYPRSRSNSKREGGSGSGNSNENAELQALITRTKQIQQQRNQVQTQTSNGNSLVSKLQALGLDPSGGGQQQEQAAVPSALAEDPAIVLARKSSVKPQEMGGSGSSSQGAGESAFRSSLPVPTTHAQNGTAANVGAYSAMQPPPSPPALHPVPSPYPASTITTPLPSNANPALAQRMQQAFWHAQMGPMEGMPAHASPGPLPPPQFAMMPGMHAFPQLAAGHPGMHGSPAPMPPFVSGTPQAQAQAPPPPPPAASSAMAQNLAEQLVSLVKQRMNPGQSSEPAAGVQAQAQVPPEVVKAQRAFCRDWLIHVIQSDDELVDAFVQRFPPPIFPGSAATMPQQQQQPAQSQSPPSSAQA